MIFHPSFLDFCAHPEMSPAMAGFGQDQGVRKITAPIKYAALPPS